MPFKFQSLISRVRYFHPPAVGLDALVKNDLILEIFKRQPVVQLKRLLGLMTSPEVSSTNETLKWMLNAGILLRTRPMNPSIDPQLIDEQMSRPLFTIQNVDYRSDVYVIKQMW